ncbi:acyl-CoA dehydrogenase family protein [Pseudomonas sp. LP_7_YM]|uniref:acyl-CoA dehydrogenase family protein n=1 Tax=Pseudomonas sp. LP_7_YM TaxID=2485137 RepID=UPI001060F594|nr:acyl-CoA dehydrogenase family protein [Pseudomonas sp. LP_7_YM]TDV72640.1 alkylation response protein AidB-like acyl-CoA dehydrogenase [Pseudomonas sp. LP_7_YM]
MRELFESTIERLLSDGADSETVNASEGGVWAATLWDAIEDSGFTLAAAPEFLGGADAGWADLYVIARAAGRFAVPLPLTEALLANWLLGCCGLEPRTGSLSICARPRLLLNDDRVSGVLPDVPWGRHVESVVAIADSDDGGPTLVVLPRAQAQRIEQSLNIAGEPRDALFFSEATVLDRAPLPSGLNSEALQTGGALMRSAQIAGALSTLLDMTAEYAGQRNQFGKPIGAFQAIQQQLAVFAEQAAAANSAAEAAFAESDRALNWFSVAVAKVTTAEAATQGANIAHAVHGAIGFTQEYALQLYTRRLWAWRGEFGSTTHWSQMIGKQVCAAGAEGFWPLMTDNSSCGASA